VSHLKGKDGKFVLCISHLTSAVFRWRPIFSPHIHLSECVNKQNMCYWSEENPRELHERPLHSDRVTVRCARIIGPYFFEEGGRAVTVTSARYLNIIQDFFFHASS
jgi:hypothetical protein